MNDSLIKSFFATHWHINVTCGQTEKFPQQRQKKLYKLWKGLMMLYQCSRTPIGQFVKPCLIVALHKQPECCNMPVPDKPCIQEVTCDSLYMILVSFVRHCINECFNLRPASVGQQFKIHSNPISSQKCKARCKLWSWLIIQQVWVYFMGATSRGSKKSIRLFILWD